MSHLTLFERLVGTISRTAEQRDGAKAEIPRAEAAKEGRFYLLEDG